MYSQKLIHPYRFWEDELRNDKDYAAHRPILPLLLSLVDWVALQEDWQ